jgi:hypothetical protein
LTLDTEAFASEPRGKYRLIDRFEQSWSKLSMDEQATLDGPARQKFDIRHALRVPRVLRGFV